jgi:hypothetical protein
MSLSQWKKLEPMVVEYIKANGIIEGYIDLFPAPNGPPIEGLNMLDGVCCSDCDLASPTVHSLRNHWPKVHKRPFRHDSNAIDCTIQPLYSSCNNRHYIQVNPHLAPVSAPIARLLAEFYETHDPLFQTIRERPASAVQPKDRPPAVRLLNCDKFVKPEQLANRKWVTEVQNTTHPSTKCTPIACYIFLLSYNFLDFMATIMDDAPPSIFPLLTEDEM